MAGSQDLRHDKRALYSRALLKETLLFKIAVSQPTVMAAPDFEANGACRRLVDGGYVNCERFGGVPRSVACLTASIKGLHYCCDHVDEMDEETIGFLPLF